MEINFKSLEKTQKIYGDSFYILDAGKFITNYNELLGSFRKIYSNTHIAYSYKTNYTPRFCKIIDSLGGFAEVVSDMEYKLALKIGVNPKNIYLNGPYKNPQAVEELLLSGGVVNLDSDSDVGIIIDVAQKHPNKSLSIGLRCNFDVFDGVLSRFGFDVESDNFCSTIDQLKKHPNINIEGLHCHFATRSLETWPRRADGIIAIINKHFSGTLKFVSLGGGLYGKMSNQLKAQFNVNIPNYEDYATAVATKFRDYFSNVDPKKRPKLLIEPGTALAGDAMMFATKVISIKDIRGKKIASLAGSIYNINPTLNTKNPPIKIFHDSSSDHIQVYYENLDLGGYTCIESDYLFKGYKGNLAVGDFILFENVGSYSVVLKPPFILPNYAIIEYDEKSGEIVLIKKKESFEDVFQTFEF